MPDGSVIGMCLILTWMLKIFYFLKQTMTVIRKRYVSITIQNDHYHFSCAPCLIKPILFKITHNIIFIFLQKLKYVYHTF